MADRKILAQINVTPFVDVMLVLLVIFLVTAPMMQTGIDVNLPRAEGAPIESAEEPVVITIDRDRRIFILDRAIEDEALRAKLEAIFKTRGEKVVFLKADSSVPYGKVAFVMAELKKAGAEKIAMITEPAEN